MDQLAPPNVPMYETRAEGRDLWERCADHGDPVVSVRDGERGYIVRYDLDHLDRRLSTTALRDLRERIRSARATVSGVDPESQTEAVGGEVGPVAGDLHVETEFEARQLASHVSAFVFDPENHV
jgi:hypothetical protein